MIDDRVKLAQENEKLNKEKSIQKVINKEKIIRAKIMSKDETLEKVKLKQRLENDEKFKFFSLNKQLEEEQQAKMQRQLERHVIEKMKRSEVKDKQDKLKAMLAHEINMLRKREQEMNLKAL